MPAPKNFGRDRQQWMRPPALGSSDRTWRSAPHRLGRMITASRPAPIRRPQVVAGDHGRCPRSARAQAASSARKHAASRSAGAEIRSADAHAGARHGGERDRLFNAAGSLKSAGNPFTAGRRVPGCGFRRPFRCRRHRRRRDDAGSSMARRTAAVSTSRSRRSERKMGVSGAFPGAIADPARPAVARPAADYRNHPLHPMPRG
jgi:hypothetical protein